ncbi:TetR/AcrR family transcriptional regulator [Pseudomonas helleri]|uniref:TetR/AcrR family transcriptional regulator n=1 Tax=Pseudomonas helleri TaxID=1608996 RepID=UPI003FD15426
MKSPFWYIGDLFFRAAIMTTLVQKESGVRARTRVAILEAARKLLPPNPSASIIDIAEASGVGRSTIHRYFRDRTELLEALARHVYCLSDEAIARARPESGPPVMALRRIIEEQFDLGPALDFIYNEGLVRQKPELYADLTAGEIQVANAIRRASKEDAAISFEWRERVFWTLLRLGAEVSAEGKARHEIIDAIMNTLTAGFITAD